VPDKLKPEAKELLKQFDALTGDTLNATKPEEDNPDEGKDGKGGKKKKLWK
jgi:molecular chaperone DnaJ